jgi:3-dehydroquinate dehydratase/shikimate dehydrogenase
MKIAVPITAATMDEALRDIDKASEVADIIELRLDFMSNPNLERLLGHTTTPKIVTNRTKLEGGRFSGSEEERISYLKEAVSLGAEYVDIESDYFQAFDRGRSKLIVSHHNFDRTPSNRRLRDVYDCILEKNPDIIKIATKADNYRDSIRMLNLVLEADISMIGICMGQYGIITRVLGPIYGSYLTFASLEEGKSSAPGQLSVAELKSAWKLLQIE